MLLNQRSVATPSQNPGGGRLDGTERAGSVLLPWLAAARAFSAARLFS